MDTKQTYRIDIVKSPKGFSWSLFETATEQVVDDFPTEKAARERYRFLKRGGAFNGWTPKFVLTKIDTKGLKNDNI